MDVIGYCVVCILNVNVIGFIWCEEIILVFVLFENGRREVLMCKGGLIGVIRGERSGRIVVRWIWEIIEVKGVGV